MGIIHSGRIIGTMDVNAFDQLGTGDRYNNYLVHYYENEIPGDNDEKFEFMKELQARHDDLRELMEEKGIELPSQASDMFGDGGFFDSLDESQA